MGQKEISGKGLTPSVINAAYGSSDVALVGSQKIRRVQHNGAYRYFLYEPLKWKVISYDAAQMTLASESIIDVLDGSGWNGEPDEGCLGRFLDELIADAFSDRERDAMRSEARIMDDDMIESETSGFCSRATRHLSITAYARASGGLSGAGPFPYWLQSGEGRRLSGHIDRDGNAIYSVFSGRKGIVPVITISRYPYLWKADGMASSGEEGEGNSPSDGDDGMLADGGGQEPGSTIKGDAAIFTNKKPGNIKIMNKTWNSQKVTWSRVKSAQNYAVYVSKSRTGAYRLLGTTKSRSIMNGSLAVGKRYYYRVVGYRVVHGAVQYSRVSNAMGKRAGVPSRPDMKASRKRKGGRAYVFVKWNISDARYVQLYRKRGKKFQKIFDSKLSKGFKRGVTIQYSYMHGKYEYKIRAYNQAGRKKVYSKFSRKKGIRI